MNKFDEIHRLNLDGFAEWMDKNCGFDDTPWTNWWDDTYCKKCQTEKIKDECGNEHKAAWCELYNKCKFFQTMDEIPENKDIIRMWLMSEAE